MTIDGLLRLATMAAAASGKAGSIGRTTGRMTAAVLCASLAAVSAIAAGGCAAATLWLFAGARRWLGCRKRRSQTVSKILHRLGSVDRSAFIRGNAGASSMRTTVL
jgi:hypothetical protein